MKYKTTKSTLLHRSTNPTKHGTHKNQQVRKFRFVSEQKQGKDSVFGRKRKRVLREKRTGPHWADFGEPARDNCRDAMRVLGGTIGFEGEGGS